MSVAILVLVGALVIGTTIWVAYDHRSMTAWYGTEFAGDDVSGWILGCLLLWILVFPMYVIHRRQVRRAYYRAEFDRSREECINCGEVRGPGSKFCSLCGHSYARNECESCGADLQEADRFCPACGAAVEIA